MNTTFWWVLLLVLGLILGNLWLLRHSKNQDKLAQQKNEPQDKRSDGAATSSVLSTSATSATDASRLKQVDSTDHHQHSTDAGSHDSSGSD